MITLPIFIVILTIATHLVNTVAPQAINNALWSIYTRLGSKTPQEARRLKTLQREVVTLRAQLRTMSSQDEFARWAKLARELDRKTAELGKLTSSVNAAHTTFDMQVGFVRWLSTWVTYLAISVWYRREPVFWFPEDWVPASVEWGLSFPKAPIGSVSVTVWAFAISQVIKLLTPIVGSLLAFFAAKFGMRAPATPMPAVVEEWEEGKARREL